MSKKGQGARGKPRKYKTAEELQTAVNAYFAKNRTKPTISGLALHLGFRDRQSIYDQMQIGDNYSCIIEIAITRIEALMEKALYRAASTQGPIFWLRVHSNAKARRGMWCDKQDIDITSGGEKIQAPQVVVTKNEVAQALNNAKEL